ncbi:MAG: GAF domain-containing sensor histidine kinase [Candidatus Aquicultorales bacterium]
MSQEITDTAREDSSRESRHLEGLVLKTLLEATSSLVLEDVLTSAARSIAEAVDRKFCGIYLVEEGNPFLRMRGRTGHLMNNELLAAIQKYPLTIDEPLTQAALVSETPLIYPDVKDSPVSEVHKEQLGLKSLLVIPLRARGKMVGYAMIPTFDRYVEFLPEKVETANAIAQALALAIDNAQLFKQSQEVAVLEERNRLAQDIHDGLAQRLTGIVLQLEAAETLLEAGKDGAARRVVRAKELARESLEEARRSVWNLRPKALVETSIVEAIRHELDYLAEDTSMATSFAVRGERCRLPDKTEEHLLRMVQEALGNVRKHSLAENVYVTFYFEKDRLRIVVADDGVGFGADGTGRSRGYGLPGLRERAAEIGGTVEITSESGEGSTVSIAIPVERSREE